MTSILQHIYDVFVGKAETHPTPEYLGHILLHVTQSLGPCRHLQLAWFLCALEERLPSTGFLLADPKQTSLAKIFTSLYLVASDLQWHHTQIANQDTKREPGTSHSSMYCEPLGNSLSRAINRVQSKIDFPDCLLEKFIAPGDSRPLIPLIISSPLLKGVITRYETSYRAYIDQLHLSRKPGNNDWIFRWCAEWLAEVQGTKDSKPIMINWGRCVPGSTGKGTSPRRGSNTDEVLSQSGEPATRKSAGSPLNPENPQSQSAIPNTNHENLKSLPVRAFEFQSTAPATKSATSVLSVEKPLFQSLSTAPTTKSATSGRETRPLSNSGRRGNARACISFGGRTYHRGPRQSGRHRPSSTTVHVHRTGKVLD